MRFVDIIEKKKTKAALTQEEIQFWIQGYVRGEIPDYQVSALLMAIYFQGMDAEETAYLSEAMLYSGERMDLSSIPGRKGDKHSTGGVGDKTSLALAPMVAACGLKVAKMSGRGLGHTGGTLDKMESIKGFQIHLAETDFLRQVDEIGLAIIGQSKNLVPADKLLYALRDVTGTVNSIPLIASSIMSKKLACGADSILLDVKYGEGAFMPTPEKAEELAKAMIAIGTHFGKDTRAMISNMKQPLGNAIGNALEVKEAIMTLQGEGPQDFTQLCLEAGALMLLQNDLADTMEDAMAKLQDAITSGRAFQKLKDMVAYQGGDVEQIEHPEFLPQAKEVIAIASPQSGYVKELHALHLGTLAMQLGAGRQVKEDTIDPAVGIVLVKKDGDYVNKGDTLAYVHTNRPLTAAWLEEFHQTYAFSEQPVKKIPLIHTVLD